MDQIRTENDDKWKAYQRAIRQMREALDSVDGFTDIGVIECAIHNASEIGRIQREAFYGRPQEETS